jgi:hypothetical protein
VPIDPEPAQDPAPPEMPRKAAEAGRSELRLLTNGAFEANVSLYKKHGYVIDREEPFMNGMTVYMSKKLA